MHDATRMALDTVVRSAERLAGLDYQPDMVLAEVAYMTRQLEALQRQAVIDARAAGMSWTEVGEVLGVTRQAAQQRFGQSVVSASIAATDAK